MLAHARLDGLDQVKVPFAERYVHAWQRGAPKRYMDVHTLIGVIKVRFRSFSTVRHGRVVAGHRRGPEQGTPW